MTQGVPLTMILYGIRILLIIIELCTAHPHVTQPWYVDDSVAGGTFKSLHYHMSNFLVRGSQRKYFREPTKSIFVVSPQNLHCEDARIQRMCVRVVTGICYLGGFIGYQESEKLWMLEKLEGWTHSVEVLAGVARHHPKTSYASLQKFLQQ